MAVAAYSVTVADEAADEDNEDVAWLLALDDGAETTLNDLGSVEARREPSSEGPAVDEDKKPLDR